MTLKQIPLLIETREDKCPSCNWNNTVFYRLEDGMKDAVCADCLLAVIIRQRIHLMKEVGV